MTFPSLRPVGTAEFRNIIIFLVLTSGVPMGRIIYQNFGDAVLTTHNVSDEMTTRLSQLAARQGCSLEEEIRYLLFRAANQTERKGLGTRISQQFAEIAGVELAIPPRSASRHTSLFLDEAE